MKAGLKKLGKKRKDGARKEVKQLSSRTALEHAHQNNLTKEMQSYEKLIFSRKRYMTQWKTKCMQVEAQNEV